MHLALRFLANGFQGVTVGSSPSPALEFKRHQHRCCCGHGGRPGDGLPLAVCGRQQQRRRRKPRGKCTGGRPPLSAAAAWAFRGSDGLHDAGPEPWMSVLPTVAHLQQLELSEGLAGDGGTRELEATLPRLPRLRQLRLSPSRISDAGARTIAAAVRPLKELQLLCVEGSVTPVGATLLLSLQPSKPSRGNRSCRWVETASATPVPLHCRPPCVTSRSCNGWVWDTTMSATLGLLPWLHAQRCRTSNSCKCCRSGETSAARRRRCTSGAQGG